MQGDAIVNRILADGKLKANEILEDAKQKAFKINKEAEEYAVLKNEEAEKLIIERARQIEDRYVVLSRIEGNKIILNKKQEVLAELKKKALDILLKQDKDKMLSLIEKMLKENASKGETLKVNIDTISLKDIENLKIVKTKELKVVKNKNKDEIGLVLSSSNVDKNLTFYELINSAYEESQGEIGKILFQIEN